MKESKCILGYTSLYVDPDGTVKPCCIAKPFKDNLNWNDSDTIDGLFNSEQFKILRKEMDSGTPPSECDICFKQGNPLRNNWNTIWADKLEDPLLFNEDYSVDYVKYLDVRFSNLCNLRCRMCGPSLSSTWYDDIVEIYGKAATGDKGKFINIGKTPVDKFKDVDLEKIEHLYLAGGEPFITDDVFKLLARFSPEQASGINMYINTNGSTLKYKKQNILEILSKFKKVSIGCSCDGYGEVGEYQRTGFISDRFFNNLREMVKFSKTHTNIRPEVEFTITLMNVFHIFDFIEYITSNDILPESHIHFHWASEPYYFSVAAAPDKFKTKVINYLKGNLEQREYCEDIVSVLGDFEKFIMIDSNTITKGDIRKDLKFFINKLDSMRNTSYKEICPWIEMMFPENAQ